MRAAAIVGYPRLKGDCATPVNEAGARLDRDTAARIGEDLCHVHYRAVQAEYDSFDASGLETVHTGPFGDMPILVMSQDTTKQFSSSNPTAREREFASAWNGLQENLSGAGPQRGTSVVIE